MSHHQRFWDRDTEKKFIAVNVFTAVFCLLSFVVTFYAWRVGRLPPRSRKISGVAVAFIVFTSLPEILRHVPGWTFYCRSSALIIAYVLRILLSIIWNLGEGYRSHDLLCMQMINRERLERQFKSFLLPAIPGLLLGAADAQPFAEGRHCNVNVSITVPFLQVGVLLVVWQILLGRGIWWSHVATSFLFAAACAGRYSEGTFAFDVVGWDTRDASGRIAQALLRTTGIVCVESIIRNQGLRPGFVSLSLYVSGLASLTICLAVGLERRRVFQDLYQWKAWLLLFHDGPMLATIVAWAILGLVTVQFLREHTAVSMELCTSVAVVISTVAGTVKTTQGVASTVFVAIAVLLYLVNPLCIQDKESPREPAPRHQPQQQQVSETELEGTLPGDSLMAPI